MEKQKINKKKQTNKTFYNKIKKSQKKKKKKNKKKQKKKTNTNLYTFDDIPL